MNLFQSGVASVFAGSGVSGYADGVGTMATFENLQAIVVDANDVLFVVDNYMIRRITTSG